MTEYKRKQRAKQANDPPEVILQRKKAASAATKKWKIAGKTPAAVAAKDAQKNGAFFAKLTISKHQAIEAFKLAKSVAQLRERVARQKDGDQRF